MKRLIAMFLTLTMIGSFTSSKKFKCYAEESKTFTSFTYSNSIEYNNGFYNITTFLDNKERYQYKITDYGMISFSFSENSFDEITPKSCGLLVDSMMEVANSINPNFLTGRTKDGIIIELKLHYFAYKIGHDVERSEVVDVGALNGVGYDYNASGFEKIKDIVK